MEIELSEGEIVIILNKHLKDRLKLKEEDIKEFHWKDYNFPSGYVVRFEEEDK